MAKAKAAESVVAVMEVNTGLREQQLTEEVSEIEFQAEATIIANDADYEEAAEFGRTLKDKAANVIGFFKPMKDSAYQAHKTVCDREKKMLAPLQKAEKIIKKTMGDYVAEQERKRIAQEEALRTMAAEEAKRKLNQAVALESEGNTEEAHAAFAEAEVMENMGIVSSVSVAPPKVKGVSATKDWELVSISGAEVPLSFAGVDLRPVDQAAVMRLIRASKGQIQIPGIVYRETTKMSLSRR